jgi:hypothetical protein
LDAGWEEPAADSLLLTTRVAATTEPATSEIDAGWDLGSEPSSALVPRSSTGGKVTGQSRKKAVPSQPTKKQLRELERLSRTHQAKRDGENRVRRKAARKAQPQPTDSIGSDRTATPKKHVNMSNQQSKSSKRKAKFRKRDEMQSRPAVPERTEGTPPVQVGTNRAMRRAGTVPNPVAPASERASTRPSKRYAIGPFTLFIGVVLVASVFSYLFIR